MKNDVSMTFKQIIKNPFESENGLSVSQKLEQTEINTLKSFDNRTLAADVGRSSHQPRSNGIVSQLMLSILPLKR